jgi:hypothetical protein
MHTIGSSAVHPVPLRFGSGGLGRQRCQAIYVRPIKLTSKVHIKAKNKRKKGPTLNDLCLYQYGLFLPPARVISSSQLPAQELVAVVWTAFKPFPRPGSFIKPL